VFAFFSLGCINLFNDDESVPRPDLSGLQCGEFTGDAPQMGFVWDDFEPLSNSCPDMPIEPGFQGGFHITPAIWVPLDMQTAEMGGVVTTRVTFVNADIEPIEQTLELFPGQWEPVAAGSAVRTRIILPNQLVEEGGRWDVQIDFEVEFDAPEQQGVSISETTQLYLEVQ
jgi:hypothetical protein